jgi:hypothetical protein
VRIASRAIIHWVRYENAPVTIDAGRHFGEKPVPEMSMPGGPGAARTLEAASGL